MCIPIPSAFEPLWSAFSLLRALDSSPSALSVLHLRHALSIFHSSVDKDTQVKQEGNSLTTFHSAHQNRIHVSCYVNTFRRPGFLTHARYPSTDTQDNFRCHGGGLLSPQLFIRRPKKRLLYQSCYPFISLRRTRLNVERCT